MPKKEVKEYSCYDLVLQYFEEAEEKKANINDVFEYIKQEKDLDEEAFKKTKKMLYLEIVTSADFVFLGDSVWGLKIYYPKQWKLDSSEFFKHDNYDESLLEEEIIYSNKKQAKSVERMDEIVIEEEYPDLEDEDDSEDIFDLGEDKGEGAGEEIDVDISNLDDDLTLDDDDDDYHQYKKK
jgi:DNA-directed RNA polymerase subunit delta